MTRWRLLVEYDGRPYVGWQRQDNGPSAQAALETAAAALAGGPVAVVGAGRTDAGVHARGQVAHFDCAREIAPRKMADALNHHLRGEAVAVLRAAPVPAAFHARFSAVRRRYRYRIVNRRAPLTVDAGLAWRIARPLDAAEMAQAARALIGLHDFTTFRAAACRAASPVKTLDRLELRREGDEIAVIAEARSFLHNQVRSIVGTLARVGEGAWTAADVAAALDARDRAACGPVAPPDGLYLEAVGYPPAATAWGAGETAARGAAGVDAGSASASASASADAEVSEDWAAEPGK